MKKTRPKIGWIKDIKSYKEQRDEIWKIIDQYTGNPALVNFAAYLIKVENIPARDELALARAVQIFAQHKIKFFREYPERWQSPLQTLALKIGDCDDKTILIASILRSFRIPVRLIFLRFKLPNKKPYSHVYPQAKINNRWVSLESVQTYFKLGDDPATLAKNKGFNIKTESIGDR
jgi:transglutaminase-like putative cysteine protease